MENTSLHHVVMKTLVHMLGAPAVAAQDDVQNTPASGLVEHQA
jgi:hypothetical protein